MTAHFENPEGWRLVKDAVQSTWWKAQYEFMLSRTHPLTYVDAHGNRWQPNRHYFTDMGSVPKVGQLLIPKDRFLGFYLHDSAYIEGGLWLKTLVAARFEFVRLPKSRVDEMLHDMCMADPVPCWESTADVVYRAVRMATPFVDYGKGDKTNGKQNQS